MSIRNLFLLVPLMVACTAKAPPSGDPHSFSRPERVRVTHLDLDLDVDFDARTLSGRASWKLDRRRGTELRLDVDGIVVERVTLEPGGRSAEFEVGDPVEHLGRPLTVRLAPETTEVHVHYRTGPESTALQWLEPEQTAGGRRPFLLTQSQSVFARTWVPCQDTPGVRFTYDATLRVPPGLLALMSAENPTEIAADGVYRFRMPQPIPSYLLAAVVGEIAFRPLDARSGVYAEPAMLDRAAWEFAETPRMIDVAEALYGEYAWGRYDLIVLPPSFPFGGMENPRLSFITPTLIAGDRSLVSTIAHELAHSWSGNLVTNATWSDFWLNEGFTVYFEKRIMEELYGRDYVEMLSVLDQKELRDRIEEMGVDHPDTRLALELAGRDPEDCFSNIAYDKGYLFLRHLEESLGRDRFDEILADYFHEHAFRSMTSDRFVAWLRARAPEVTDVDEWVYGRGLPAGGPTPVSDALAAVDRRREAFVSGGRADEVDPEGWTAHHHLRFLRGLPDDLPAERLAELDRWLGLSDSGNAEILVAWLLVAADRGHPDADAARERFLLRVGRLKFLRPLYRHMIAAQGGRARAGEIYRRARPGYHAIAREELDALLGVP